MTDNTELKRLAEAATQGEWQVIETELPCRIGRPHVERRIFTAKDHPQLKAPYPVVNGSVALGTDETPVHHMVSMTAEDAAFVAAANPAAVLALIAENERLERLALDSVNAEYAGSMDLESICAERDQLKAENEALKGPHDWLAEDLIKELVDNAQAIQENADDGEEDPFVIVLLAAAQRIRRQEANIDKIKAENERLAKTADCWDRLNIQNKALSDSFRAERDQLSAEVAGLKTGYEAYEQVNAELKAENEALRGAGAGALRFVAFAFDEGVEGAELAGRAIEDAIGAKS